MFFKLFRYDLKVGIGYRYKKILMVIAIFSVSFIDFFFKFKSYTSSPTLFPIDGSLGNVLFYVFGGMQEYDPHWDKQFIFPAKWMLLYLLLAYLTLYYPYNNLFEHGQNILIRSGGRCLWWTSKCLWNICTVVLFFLIGWTVLLLGCITTKIPISLELSRNMWMFLGMREFGQYLYPKNLSLEILLLPILVMMACNILQMTLSLFIRPIYSFMITGLLLLGSAYYQSPFLIGNYAMPIRSNRMIENGMNPYCGILFSAVLVIGCFILGLFYFKKYDILKKE